MNVETTIGGASSFTTDVQSVRVDLLEKAIEMTVVASGLEMSLYDADGQITKSLWVDIADLRKLIEEKGRSE